jgi:Protein of unknown function (DUF3892)
MSKWADYGISDVNFNYPHTHIDSVKIRPDSGETIGLAAEHSRADIVAAIKGGIKFVTIFQNANGTWNKGQPVYIVRIHGTEFIKTVDNGRPVDNLDNLPEF